MTGGPDACWPWKGSLAGGKGRPYFTVDGKKVLAYRLVYELVSGEKLEDDDVIRHTCDNGASGIGCCNPAHLVKGTHQENMDDMKERQRHGLPHNTVRAIRRLLEEGQTHETIARLYGISREAVTHINNKRAYRDVE